MRGVGISPVATGDRGRCPLAPCDFLKKSSKTFQFWVVILIWCGRLEDVR